MESSGREAGGPIEADVAIVGAGLAGLVAARLAGDLTAGIG